MAKWQPIETAPKDGSFIVFARFVGNSPPEYEVGQYRPSKWPEYVPAGDDLYRKVDRVLCEWTINNPLRMTHWMHLPEAP